MQLRLPLDAVCPNNAMKTTAQWLRAKLPWSCPHHGCYLHKYDRGKIADGQVCRKGTRTRPASQANKLRQDDTFTRSSV
jgi:hypothetical protein